MSTLLDEAISHWKYIAPVIKRPENDRDYDELVAYLDVLLDKVGEDEQHPLVGLVDVISNQIDRYDAEHFPISGGTGIDALRYLMEDHHLTQVDLKDEIGSQGVVSEILNGRRKLNVNHIKKLANRFKVSADTFID